MKKSTKSRILTICNVFTPLVDIGVLFVLASTLIKKEDKAMTVAGYACIALVAFVCWRWAKAIYLVLKSKSEADYYLLANRVIPICGKQRAGKSSLASYLATRALGNVYSNIPLRIRGNYTNKLTTDVLTCRTQIPDGSLLIVDEANLFYNNIHSDIDDNNIFGQAILCQLVGHFFDGNIIYSAVDTDRIPKQLRACYSAQLQVVGSAPYRYSFIGDALLRLAVKFTLKEKRIFTGLRVWKAQHYEKIKEEQYVSLLGDKENEFSPLIKFACWQNFGLSQYDDRYMKAYYKDMPEEPKLLWDSLEINKKDFENLYDSVMINYLTNIAKEREEMNKTVRIRYNSEK